MAADPTLAPNPALGVDDANFENEISTYRALSPLAILSAGLGLLAGLSFVSPFWMIAAVLAVVTGVVADYRIRKMPYILTGRNFASAGIALGLMFGLSSVCYSYWSIWTLKRDSRSFAGEFAQTLNKAKTISPPDTAEVMWYMLHPDMRKGITPDDARQKIAQVSEGSAKIQTIEVQLRQMAKYAGAKSPVEVVEVEDAFFQDRDGYASVLLKVGDGHDHSEEHDHASVTPVVKKPGSVELEIIGEGPEHALIVLHRVSVGQDYRFFVEQLQYPYKPKNYKLVAPKVAKDDDGHGHDH